MKTGLSAKGGIQSSFMKILIESANTWSKPKGPTRFGPYRSCQRANNRRSTQIRKAAMLSATMTMPRMERIGYGLVISASRSLPT